MDEKSSLVTALATVAIAGLTVFLARENRKLRRAGEEPCVIPYLVPHPDGNGGVNMVFANVGLGPAKDVAFEIECDESDFVSHNVLLDQLTATAPINFIPSGSEVAFLFGVSFELFGNTSEAPLLPLKAFSVTLKFQTISGRTRSTTTEIDISQFAGLRGMMNKPAIREIENTLKRMDKRFDKLAKASDKFVQFVDATALEDPTRKTLKGRNETE